MSSNIVYLKSTDRIIKAKVSKSKMLVFVDETGCTSYAQLLLVVQLLGSTNAYAVILRFNYTGEKLCSDTATGSTIDNHIVMLHKTRLVCVIIVTCISFLFSF